MHRNAARNEIFLRRRARGRRRPEAQQRTSNKMQPGPDTAQDQSKGEGGKVDSGARQGEGQQSNTGE